MKTNTRRTGETIVRKNKKGRFNEEKKRSGAIETICRTGRFTSGGKEMAVRSIEADRPGERRNGYKIRNKTIDIKVANS